MKNVLTLESQYTTSHHDVSEQTKELLDVASIQTFERALNPYPAEEIRLADNADAKCGNVAHGGQRLDEVACGILGSARVRELVETSVRGVESGV